MLKPKQVPIIYISRIDWSGIVRHNLESRGITDESTFALAMANPNKRLAGFPVVIDDAQAVGEPLLLGFGVESVHYEGQVKVIIRESGKMSNESTAI